MKRSIEPLVFRSGPLPLLNHLRKRLSPCLIAVLLWLPFIQLEAQLQPIPLGQSAVFSIGSVVKNQIVVNNDLGLVAWFHRSRLPSDTVSNLYRADVSWDRGNSFIKDREPANITRPHSLFWGQTALLNPPGNTDSTQAALICTQLNADYLSSALGWDMLGILETTIPLANNSTIPYVSTLRGNLSNLGWPGSLCNSNWNTFWMPSQSLKGDTLLDTLFLNTGYFFPQTQNLNWVRSHALHLPLDRSIDPKGPVSRPSMGFSPDGTQGWIAMMADLVGGQDSAYQPILIHSTDGGTSWGNPISVDLNQFSWIQDSIRAYPLDTNGQPVFDGTIHPGAIEHDLTVDVNGNPHLVILVGPARYNGAPLDPYRILRHGWKGLIDLSTTDGGTTWTSTLISPIHSTPSMPGGPLDDYPPGMYYKLQVSRTESGSHLFFSWIDSDTAEVSTLFSSYTDNMIPDLYSLGIRVADGYRTCKRNHTRNDPDWHGHVWHPTASPTVLDQNGIYNVPIVSIEWEFPESMLENRDFLYWGNIVEWGESEFMNPVGMDLSWGAQCFLPPVSIDPALESPLEFQLYPNPGRNRFTLEGTVATKGPVEVRILDTMGRILQQKQILSFPDENDKQMIRETLNLQGAASGMYWVEVISGEKSQRLLWMNAGN